MARAVDDTTKAVSYLAMDSEGTLSKNARKKELKNKQKEEERRRKEEEMAKETAATTSSQVKKIVATEDEEMNPTQYFENRLKFLAAQKADT